MRGLAAGAILAWALAAGPAWCQVADKPDTVAESDSRGIPWIFRSSAEAFYLASPSAGGSQPYQVSFYQGVTVQSLRFAWFHAGLRTRETMGPGFGRPYREPMLLKLMATAEVLREYAYVFLAGNLPLMANHVSAADTALMADAISGYSPFPYPNFLSSQAIHFGAFGRYRLTAWDVMAGASYARAGKAEPYPAAPFFPAPYFDLFARALYEGKAARHRFDTKLTVYGEETTHLRIAAHQEGSLWQLRYGYLRFARGKSWQLGLGGSFKMNDDNRRVRLERPLVTTPSNDNIQRAYAEMALSFAPGSDWLARAHLQPRSLIVMGQSLESGHETEMGLSVARRMWKVHRLRMAGNALYGQFRDQTYLGFGCRLEFAFRNLGLQDLEEQGGLPEGN